MSDFAAAWELSRGRFVDAISDLDAAQLNWRLHPEALTIGEMALHVAGVEAMFTRQLLDLQPDPSLERLSSAATDGVVNDRPFPYTPEEITPDAVRRALETTRALVEPMIANPDDALRNRKLVSALGPVIDGSGAMARFAFHAGYHQGQVHLIRTAPGFPA